jgi:transposase
MGYPSDMSDEEWAVLEPYTLPYEGYCRPRRSDMRQILNAIRYVERSGCQWRMLPKDYPPWHLVYYYYYDWRKRGKWDEIHDALHRQVRQQAGRHAIPSVGIVDSRSVKLAQKGGSAATTRARR